MSDSSIFGYYDAPGQTQPAYDPGRNVPCQFCLRRLGAGDIRFISLMLPGDRRRYFYGYHFGCYSAPAADQIEAALINSRVAITAPNQAGHA